MDTVGREIIAAVATPGERDAMKRIGVDVGGTFTDLILVDEEAGRITVDKVPSTPDDPARGVVEGIQAAVREGRRRRCRRSTTSCTARPSRRTSCSPTPAPRSG